MRRILFALLALVCLSAGTSAQELPAVPLDPQVRMGTLPNGLTYYIRHNEWPQRRADFYIAQKVGSMQEEDNQRGLAHFLEHMCFNGTKHFPGDNLKQYLERIGVRFGENLNAYTAFDETVYNINNVNVDIQGAVDSCILILHDWSNALLLQDTEIDKERGVINEEWRVRRTAMMRMQERAIATLFPDNKYGQRMPIGTMDVVMNFPYNTLRDYYHRWYRPDLQGLVIVGDVNPDRIEEIIKHTFSDIAAPAAEAPERIYYPVSANKEPLVAIEKDKEQPTALAMIMHKFPAMERAQRGTMGYYVQQYVWNAACSMLQTRIQEILSKPNPPFTNCFTSYENFLVANTQDALNTVVMLKTDALTEGMSAAYRELLRASRFGFTTSEYQRFQQEILSGLEDRYAKRDKVENEELVDAYVRHFIDGVPAPGIEWEYQTLKELIPATPLEAVNQAAGSLGASQGLAIALFLPDKEGINVPTREQVLHALQTVEQEDIEGFKEEVDERPLIDGLATEGQVTKEAGSVYESQMVTLSNGIRVYMLPTNHEPNTIQMNAYSWGGTSLYPDSLYITSGNTSLVPLGGLGKFSSVQLNKKLAGKQVSVEPFIGDRTEGIKASCVKKDLETMLQLTYLTFTEPRRDDEVYAAYTERIKTLLANQDLNPKSALTDSVASVLYHNDVRAVRMRAEDVDRISYDQMLQIYKERFADANDFTFYLVGDFQPDSVKPLLAKYLGALPVLAGKERYRTISKRMADGRNTCIFEKEQDVANALVRFYYHARVKETPQNSILLSMIEQVLDMVFTESVREDEGGAYSVGVGSSITDYPVPQATVTIVLPTSPEKLSRMQEVISEGLDKLCQEGCSEEKLQKVKEYMLRSHAENIKKNAYWMNALVNNTLFKQDLVSRYEEMVKAVTSSDIQKLSKKIFQSGNCTIVGMKTPQKQQ